MIEILLKQAGISDPLMLALVQHVAESDIAVTSVNWLPISKDFVVEGTVQGKRFTLGLGGESASVFAEKLKKLQIRVPGL